MTFRSFLFLCMLPALAAQTPGPLSGETTPSVRGSTYTPAQLVAALTRDFSSHYQLDGKLELNLVSPWTPPAVTAAAWRLAILEYPPMPETTMVVRCQLSGDGAVAGTFTQLVRAAVWRPGWFIRRPLDNGGPLDPSLFEVRPVDTLRQRDAVPTTLGIRGFVASCQVPVDQVLTWHDIALRPLVHKGEIVNVVAEDGMLQVTLKALALQSGARGDLVTARNLDSLRDVTGRVVGQDCIAITF